MHKKGVIVIAFILCVGLLLAGCPKKTVLKEEPSTKKAEEAIAERERAARLEAEREARQREAREREAREKELARIREEEAKKAKEREFERSLVAKREPGIAGEVFESKLFRDIHFDFDKYDIRPGDAEILKENAALLMKYPKVKIQIEGHCDERGTNEYNMALGERRANAAKRYLISLGISSDRISTISYGEERPLDPGHNEEAWAKNRRGHFVILSK
ncbi:MAG: peptidoglycan-associated lipoprotein Pal [Thermodesulfobacteriota bacterium]